MWEAPLVDNPACNVGCGEWKRPMMLNPAYKGAWKAPKVPVLTLTTFTTPSDTASDIPYQPCLQGSVEST